MKRILLIASILVFFLLPLMQSVEIELSLNDSNCNDYLDKNIKNCPEKTEVIIKIYTELYQSFYCKDISVYLHVGDIFCGRMYQTELKETYINSTYKECHISLTNLFLGSCSSNQINSIGSRTEGKLWNISIKKDHENFRYIDSLIARVYNNEEIIKQEKEHSSTYLYIIVYILAFITSIISLVWAIKAKTKTERMKDLFIFVIATITFFIMMYLSLFSLGII